MSKPEEKEPLFRGEKYGVFAATNGYYVAEMATDGVSHYQCNGRGWSDRTRHECNNEARQLESGGMDV